MVRLRYHYHDGHTLTTETMLLSEALSQMAALHATESENGIWNCSVARIEFLFIREG